jgi:hypothetical protein
MTSSTTPIQQNDIFSLAYKFVCETAESIFLTGKAGTGKTTFLKYLQQHCSKNIVVTAPTGVAAINAGGVTLHSFFQLPFHPFLPTATEKEQLLGKIRINKTRLQLLRKMELLVIDEISMVRADVLDAIDCILRSVRRNHHTPFGGVQLLCIGDLHQLPPVAKNEEWKLLSEYYVSPYFFDSMAIREQMPLLIELDTIYRQKENVFVELLNKVRNNNMTKEDFDLLHERFIPGFHPSDDEKYITLTSHNQQADQINKRQLDALLSAASIYPAIIEGDFPEHMFPAEERLLLKRGAQVMFLRNDNIYKRFFNGKIGTVALIGDDEVIVEVDGTEISVGLETWENTRYTINREDGKMQQEVLGSFTQYPLRLAWAITIHKSQGLTFDKMMVDAAAAFSTGQVYVALSRCTSLQGLVLCSRIPPSAIQSSGRVQEAQKTLTHKGSLAERFDGARKIFTEQQLEWLFSFGELSKAFEELSGHLKSSYEKFNPAGLQWFTELHDRFKIEKQTGLRFVAQIYQLMKQEPLVESNPALQQRLCDASFHFLAKLAGMLTEVKKTPLVTEHKEAAEIANNGLQEIAAQLYQSCYFLEYCQQAFSLTGYLQHKLLLSLPRVTINTYAAKKEESIENTMHPQLYRSLKKWRDEVFESTGFPIYMIATAETLKELCHFLPLNKNQLATIKGFGKAKVEKYGDDIVDIISDYCDRHGLTSNMEAYLENKPVKKTASASRKPKTDTKRISLELLQSGLSVAAVAAERKMAVGTIEGHLGHYLEAGILSLDQVLPTSKIDIALPTVSANPGLSISALKELLPDISFGEIRMMLASLKADNKSDIGL